MNVIWEGLMEESVRIHAEEWRANNTTTRMQKHFYMEQGEKGSTRDRRLREFPIPSIPDTYRAAESAIHGNVKPTFAKRRTNSRDFPPSNRAR